MRPETVRHLLERSRLNRREDIKITEPLSIRSVVFVFPTLRTHYERTRLALPAPAVRISIRHGQASAHESYGVPLNKSEQLYGQFIAKTILLLAIQAERFNA